jgi:hypothetical protein
VTGAPLGSLFEAIRFVRKNLWGNQLPTKLVSYISYYEVATWFREVEARWLLRGHSLVSRGLLAEFFILLGRGSLSDRLATKAWRFFLLPSREDSRLQRRFNAD